MSISHLVRTMVTCCGSIPRKASASPEGMKARYDRFSAENRKIASPAFRSIVARAKASAAARSCPTQWISCKRPRSSEPEACNIRVVYRVERPRSGKERTAFISRIAHNVHFMFPLWTHVYPETVKRYASTCEACAAVPLLPLALADSIPFCQSERPNRFACQRR